MRLKWKPLLVGCSFGLLGWAVFSHAAGPLFGASVPRPPTGTEMGLLGLGSLVMLFGAFLAITPNLVTLLRMVYGDGFAAGVTCPVMVTCPSCYTYNLRTRPTCKACERSLAGARGAGSERHTLGHAADQEEARRRAEALVERTSRQ